MITNNIYLDRAYQYLFIALFFTLPITVAGSNLFAYLLVLLWLFSGNYKDKFNIIKNNKVAVASIVFFLLHIVGMLWTSDIEWGGHIVKKMMKFFILLPIFITIAKKENIHKYIIAFLAAMTISEVLSYMVWLEMIPPFKNATIYNPTPFMSHISYNPFLTIAIYLVLNKLLFDKTLTKFSKYLYAIFAITMSINMFITGGRAGQVMYFAMLVILIFQYFDKKFIKAFVLSVLIIPTIFISAYSNSKIFKDRVNLAVQNVVNYDKNPETSVGLRIHFAENSLKIIKKHPIIGAGTGDFVSEYKKVSVSNIKTPSQPHNMYLLVLSQLGIIGLISMLSIFYYQLKQSVKIKDKLNKNIAVVMPLLFLIIMLSDSYLLGHSTTILFIIFSAFLYKNYEKTKHKAYE
jgi:O-antigen ligase